MLLIFASTSSLGSERDDHNKGHLQNLKSCAFKSTGSIDTSVHVALYQGSHRLSESLYMVPIEIALPGFQPSIHSGEEVNRMKQNLYEALNEDLEEAQATGLCKDLEPIHLESCKFKSTGSIDTSVYIALYQGSHRLSESLYMVPIEIVLPGFQPSIHSGEEVNRMKQNLYGVLNEDLKEAQATGLCKDLEPIIRE